MQVNCSALTTWTTRSLAIVGMAVLYGCGGGKLAAPDAPPPPPAERAPEPLPLHVTFQASTQINPDIHGRPSPVKVTFYELRSPTSFDNADFFSLSQNEQGVLGPDLLQKQEFFLRPGETKTVTSKGFLATTAVGVFAEFRDVDKSIWHSSTALTALPTLPSLPAVPAAPALPAAPSTPSASLHGITLSGPAVPAVPTIPSISLPNSKLGPAKISTQSYQVEVNQYTVRFVAVTIPVLQKSPTQNNPGTTPDLPTLLPARPTTSQ